MMMVRCTWLVRGHIPSSRQIPGFREVREMLLPGGALFRRHVREGRGKGNAWLPVRLLVVAALGNLGNRMLHLLLPSQPQVTIGR